MRPFLWMRLASQTLNPDPFGKQQHAADTPPLGGVCAGNETIPLDEAGNPKLRDIGLFLKSAIKKHIPDADVKYIDPSNMVQVRAAGQWCRH
jgi:hypothetical protein